MADETTLRIAVISLHSDPMARLGAGSSGGMNLVLRRLCQQLSRHGVATDIVTRRVAPTLSAEEQIAPLCRVIRIDVGPPEPQSSLSQLAYVDGFVEQVAPLGAAGYAAVHGHYWLGGLAARQLHDRWNIPWAQSFHTLAHLKQEAGEGADTDREAIERELVLQADRLVAMSRSEARELVDHYGADPNRTCVAHPGADVADPDAAAVSRLRADLGLEGNRVVLFAGRLEPLKGTDTLLAALGCLLNGDGFGDVVALIAGGDSLPGERSRLEELARNAGISKVVRFIGTVDHEQLADHYALADVCVVPSRSETFGLVALESLASGTPVVAADVGGLREIVEHGKDGFLVPADDSAGFCARIGELLSNAEMRAAFGAHGSARAREFSWDRAALRLESIYRRMAQGELATPCPD